MLSPHEQSEWIERIAREEDMAWASGSPPIPLEVHPEGESFLMVIGGAYGEDTLFIKVLLHPEQHPRYTVKNGLSSLLRRPRTKSTEFLVVAIDKSHHSSFSTNLTSWLSNLLWSHRILLD